MNGLDFRLKTEESLARKIKLESESREISPQEAESQITDALRYTMLFPPDTFVDSAMATQAKMAELGYEQFDTKWSNYFQPGGAYQGYNTVMINKSTGQKFELQYHTRESVVIKEQAHIMYNEFRELPSTSPRAQELWHGMADLWSNYERPANWERLPGVIK